MDFIEAKLFGSTSKVKISNGMILCIPSHGPCKVISIEEQEIFGEKIVVCTFENSNDNIKLNIPVMRFEKMGIRKVLSKEDIESIFKNIFKKHSSVAKCIWTRRIQEYKLKFSSGNFLRIAEIVKDLYVGIKRFDKSYSERSLFNKAFDFLVSEYAVSYNVTMEEANRRVTDIFDRKKNKNAINDKMQDYNDSSDDFDDNNEYDDDDMDDVQKIA